MLAGIPIHDVTQEHIKMVFRDAFFNSVPRWMKNIWLAQRSAKLVISTTKENGRLWGKLASMSDELRFTKMELDEVTEFQRLPSFHLAGHYEAEVMERLENQQIVVSLTSYQWNYKLVMIGYDGAPDYFARTMAKETGKSWMNEIYPKIADAMKIDPDDRHPELLDIDPRETARKERQERLLRHMEEII